MVIAAPTTRWPDIDRARALAEGVLDPELPPLTIGELGIIRDVAATDDGGVIVTVTPTYSGCPAAEYIERRIAEILKAEGFSPVIVNRVFSPAWTTDWISESGRQKLSDAGIAPPSRVGESASSVAVSIGARRPAPHCPRCGSTETEQVSRFGSTACKSLCRCLACGEPFDHFKPI